MTLCAISSDQCMVFCSFPYPAALARTAYLLTHIYRSIPHTCRKIKRKLQFCGAKVFEAPGIPASVPPRRSFPAVRAAAIRGKRQICHISEKVTISMFTSRAEYAIIYIYGYNLKPQGRILYDPSGPEPGSANEGVPCSDKSEGTACAAAVAAFRLERTVRRRTRLRTCVGDGCRHGPATAVQAVAGTGMRSCSSTCSGYCARCAGRRSCCYSSARDCCTPPVRLQYRHADGSAVRDRLLVPAAGSGGQSHADTARLHPLAAYGLSLALCRDPMLSLAALMPFPAAAAAFGTRASAEREDGPGRVGVICPTSLCLGVTTLGIAALLLSRRIGSCPRASRRASGQPAHGAESPAGDADATACRADPAAVCLDRGAGTEYHQFRHQSVPRHGSHAVQPLRRAHAGHPAGQSLRIRVRRLGRGRMRLFRMSLMSSCVFLVAGILRMVTSLASSDSSLAGTVAQNIVIILHPGLSRRASCASCATQGGVGRAASRSS